jgi:glycosyltransferase involved in cell wall biosynthesis
VSVIVATHDQASYLTQALESVLDQTLDRERFEVIVVDDGSSDATPEILRRYAHRVVLLTQPHQGLVPACNLGLRHARGDYFARMDSDDFVAAGWLRRELEILDDHPDAWGVYPEYVEVMENGERRPRRADGDDGLYRLPACGVMFRTAIVRAVGGYRPLYWEEYDLYLRLRDRGRLLHVPEPLYFYRKNPAGMTAAPSRRRAGWLELIGMWGEPALRAAGTSRELDAALTEAATAKERPA